MNPQARQTIVLKLNTGADLSTATAFIRYSSPSGAKGEWPATISGMKISYQVPSGILAPGTWILRSHIVIAGQDYWGDKVKMTVDPL